MRANATLVKDIMRKDVVMVDPFASLREAMALMKKHNVRSLIVNKQNPHDAYGILTYTSLLKTIVAEDGDIDLIHVYDVAAKPVLTVSRELEIKHVAMLMVKQGIRRVAVTLNNELEGIISMDDIVGVIISAAEEE